MKVLIVDDDGDLRAVLGFALRDAGYVVVEAGDTPAAIARAAEERPDLVILDLNLPSADGLTALPVLRGEGDARRPVIVLSVRSAEEDVVKALDLGADDFLTKPFSPRTLLARLRAVSRRAGVERPEPLTAGDLAVDLERRMAVVEGRPAVRLTPKELRLLQFLVARAGETVQADRLLVHIWGSRGEADRQLLKQLVHRLRQKLEPDPQSPRYVITEAGEGYRFQPGARSS